MFAFSWSSVAHRSVSGSPQVVKIPTANDFARDTPETKHNLLGLTVNENSTLRAPMNQNPVVLLPPTFTPPAAMASSSGKINIASSSLPPSAGSDPSPLAQASGASGAHVFVAGTTQPSPSDSRGTVPLPSPPATEANSSENQTTIPFNTGGNAPITSTEMKTSSAPEKMTRIPSSSSPDIKVSQDAKILTAEDLSRDKLESEHKLLGLKPNENSTLRAPIIQNPVVVLPPTAMPSSSGNTSIVSPSSPPIGSTSGLNSLTSVNNGGQSGSSSTTNSGVSGAHVFLAGETQPSPPNSSTVSSSSSPPTAPIPESRTISSSDTTGIAPINSTKAETHSTPEKATQLTPSDSPAISSSSLPPTAAIASEKTTGSSDTGTNDAIDPTEVKNSPAPQQMPQPSPSDPSIKSSLSWPPTEPIAPENQTTTSLNTGGDASDTSTKVETASAPEQAMPPARSNFPTVTLSSSPPIEPNSTENPVVSSDDTGMETSINSNQLQTSPEPEKHSQSSDNSIPTNRLPQVVKIPTAQDISRDTPQTKHDLLGLTVTENSTLRAPTNQGTVVVLPQTATPPMSIISDSGKTGIASSTASLASSNSSSPTRNGIQRGSPINLGSPEAPVGVATETQLSPSYPPNAVLPSSLPRTAPISSESQIISSSGNDRNASKTLADVSTLSAPDPISQRATNPSSVDSDSPSDFGRPLPPLVLNLTEATGPSKPLLNITIIAPSQTDNGNSSPLIGINNVRKIPSGDGRGTSIPQPSMTLLRANPSNSPIGDSEQRPSTNTESSAFPPQSASSSFTSPATDGAAPITNGYQPATSSTGASSGAIQISKSPDSQISGGSQLQASSTTSPSTNSDVQSTSPIDARPPIITPAQVPQTSAPSETVIPNPVSPSTENVSSTGSAPAMSPESMPHLNSSSTSSAENPLSGGISSVRPGRMGLVRDPSRGSNIPSPSRLPGDQTRAASSPVGVVSGDQANPQLAPSGISYLASTYIKTTTQSMPTGILPINPIELIKPSRRKHGRRGIRNQKRRLGRT